MAKTAVEESVVPAEFAGQFPDGHAVRLIENFSGESHPDPQDPKGKLLIHTKWAYACNCGNHVETKAGSVPTAGQWKRLAARCQRVAQGWKE